MNPNVTSFMRNFVNDVKRCEEMERKLRFLKEELRKEEDYEELISEGEVAMAAAAALTLDQLEARLEQEEAELTVANNSAQMLERNRNELVELKHVLEKDQYFFQDVQAGPQEGGLLGDEERQEDAPLLAGESIQDEESFFPKVCCRSVCL